MEIKNNQVTVSGVVKSQFTYSHTVYGESFYMVTICSERLSEEADYLPLMISDRLFFSWIWQKHCQKKRCVRRKKLIFM